MRDNAAGLTGTRYGPSEDVREETRGVKLNI